MRNVLLLPIAIVSTLSLSGCFDDLLKEPGYNCVGSICLEVEDDADFVSYSSCQSNCGTGGGPCNYTQYSGTQGCSSSGYSPVASGTCCPDTHPYHCSVTGTCFSTCEGAASACGSTTVTKANLSGGGGGGGTSGYDCVSGNCQYVSSGASYSSQSACESACGGGGGAEDLAYAVTWQNSGGFWFAVGPVQSLWAGEETEEEALSYVIGSETTNYAYIGTCTNKFRVYDLNRDYNSYDLNTMDFMRENKGYTCNWP